MRGPPFEENEPLSCKERMKHKYTPNIASSSRVSTHILICGLVAGGQICMESSQADNRPDREETNEHNNHSEGRLLYYFEDLLFRFHHCSTRYLHLNGHYRVLQGILT